MTAGATMTVGSNSPRFPAHSQTSGARPTATGEAMVATTVRRAGCTRGAEALTAGAGRAGEVHGLPRSVAASDRRPSSDVNAARSTGDRGVNDYASGMTDQAPTYLVDSADGTPIAVFTSGMGPPLVLVHGASADHTTFRVVGPRLARHLTLHAIDRRGRGASGDTEPYAIAREFEDVAAVADAVAAETGGPVPVFGHSYGGRTALGASLLTDRIGRVISYEGAPTPPGVRYQPSGLDEVLRAHLAAGDRVAILSTFMAEVVGMDDAELAAFRADPVWPLRVAAAPTIVRELEAELDPGASLESLGRVRQPVLQLLGGDSLPAFREGTVALDALLAKGRVIEIPGAKHAAHHTQPGAVVTAVLDFMTGDVPPMRD